jgi:hypothetical protein
MWGHVALELLLGGWAHPPTPMWRLGLASVLVHPWATWRLGCLPGGWDPVAHTWRLGFADRDPHPRPTSGHLVLGSCRSPKGNESGVTTHDQWV